MEEFMGMLACIEDTRQQSKVRYPIKKLCRMCFCIVKRCQSSSIVPEIISVLNQQTRPIFHFVVFCRFNCNSVILFYFFFPENELENYCGVYWACGICSKGYKNQLPKP